jgi:DNA polymerase III delta subunit
MITVIHGDNIKASRELFFTKKQNEKDSVLLNGPTTNITDLAQALHGKELFADANVVFIEELFSKKKKGKDLEQLTSYVKDNSTDSQVILWESKSLTKREIDSLGNVTEKKFDFPKEIFTFLDSIKPGNSKAAIQFFHKTIEIEEPEFALFMIIRHIRILLGLNAPEGHEIDEVKRLAPWQIKKLETQAKLFGNELLINFYQKLFVIEKNMKTGKLSLSLESHIDFLLSSL